MTAPTCSLYSSTSLASFLSSTLISTSATTLVISLITSSTTTLVTSLIIPLITSSTLVISLIISLVSSSSSTPSSLTSSTTLIRLSLLPTWHFRRRSLHGLGSSSPIWNRSNNHFIETRSGILTSLAAANFLNYRCILSCSQHVCHSHPWILCQS